MKAPTYAQWLRELLRKEAAKQSRGKYWAGLTVIDREVALLAGVCRRCGITGKQLRELVGAKVQP